MKKKIGMAILGALLLLALGCATSADRAAYHQAQVDAIKAQMEAVRNIKPIVSIEALPGQNIVMSGIKKFEVYPALSGNEFREVRQFQDEYLPVYIAGLNLMGIPIGIGIQGYFANEALKTALGNKGGNTYYGSNNSGQQGVTFGGGTVIGSPGAGAANANGNAGGTGTFAPSEVVNNPVPEGGDGQ
jgi:hypothetical protein